ncbi:hypothetical protein GCM10018980_71240 [Streptomyces capoamus]|uniref:Uncharacterized protein n=1 Tax=Streptomyces capoamus TaxID=68183 RepID=A0A919KFX4_9ACTN|nr:hypothetical protein [Streptomyces capoamus]GGW13237.1 hypothetical protein GCM10010501_15990 [Streptomyces libani subsp. rufus]GHG74386.1 hypothetical protein GCM10018980_71240 [Streptomyces capoamus]
MGGESRRVEAIDTPLRPAGLLGVPLFHLNVSLGGTDAPHALARALKPATAGERMPPGTPAQPFVDALADLVKAQVG